jgi:hypothetical protein
MSDRYALETYYIGARAPHVVVYDSCTEALDAAAHVHKTHTGVTHTIARPADELVADAMRSAP